MRPGTVADRSLRWAIIGIALVLPALTLLPLGSLWLVQNGWLLVWALSACILAVAVWFGLGQVAGEPVTSRPPSSETGAPSGDPGWTPAETAAWREVEAIAETADPDAIESRDALLDLTLRIVESAARKLHPGKNDPHLQFTVPEALALVERVSQRMNAFFSENVPLGDRLTVAQMAAVWHKRDLLHKAGFAYNVWRSVRTLNPATALTSEIRERLSKEMLSWGKQHIVKRVLEAYVEEVGRAAIDLYGGRLRVKPDQLAGHILSVSEHDLAEANAPLAEPLRIVVAGQVNAGKSSLVNAMGQETRAAVDVLPATRAFTPYRLQRDGLPAALLIDSPGLGAAGSQHQALIAEAANCDLVLWVAAANRADRAVDASALSELRAHFAARPNRRRPPMLLVLSHIDRLRPFQEWAPPYDLNDQASAKAGSIRAALEAVSSDLGFAPEDAIPVCLEPGVGHYNIDALWADIMDVLPEAQRTRLVRVLRGVEGERDWSKLWQQLRNGGRFLGRTLA